MSRFDGAFGLVSDSGHPATQPSNNPPCFRYSMKNGSWPSDVTAAPSPYSHSSWTRTANVSALTDRSLPYSTDGCSPAGCPAATARPVLMPLRLHGFADFANYQLPEIGLTVSREDRHGIAPSPASSCSRMSFTLRPVTRLTRDL